MQDYQITDPNLLRAASEQAQVEQFRRDFWIKVVIEHTKQEPTQNNPTWLDFYRTERRAADAARLADELLTQYRNRFDPFSDEEKAILKTKVDKDEAEYMATFRDRKERILKSLGVTVPEAETTDKQPESIQMIAFKVCSLIIFGIGVGMCIGIAMASPQ